MTRDTKVLILYASYGTGHIQVSQALQQQFREVGIHNVVMVDLFAEAHPFINALTKLFYIKSFSVLSSLYGWSYYSTQDMRHDRTISHWFNSFGLHKLLQIIDREQPDLVINTFPMLVMPEFRRKTGIYIPTYSVLTDFDAHQRWIHPDIDRYYVATDDLKSQLVNRGVLPERVVVSGIPLRKDFERDDVSVLDLYDKYGISQSKRIALVMAGALGVTNNLEKVCETFLTGANWEVVLVCGKNSQAQERLENYFSAHRNVHVFGYVEEIHELMRIAACLVTKAGGITLSEAIALHLPILIYRPVPGQERENALYLMGQGSALILQDADDLEQIKQILIDDQTLLKMQQAIQLLQQPHAAKTIVQDVLQQLGEVEEVYEYST